MSQTLTLQIPDTLYQPLLEIAQRQGVSPEELTIQWLTASIEHFVNDPLESFIGSVQSHIPDWTERHDQYLGENLLNNQRTN